MKRTRWVIALGTIIVAAVLTYALAWRGIVLRRVKAANNSPYGAELCLARTQPAPQEPSRSWSDPAPGWLYRGQVHGRYLALTRDAVREYHTIFVWDEQLRALNAVVSVQERDPGSGSSHDYRWSRDEKALLIYGDGKLPFQSLPAELSYVYIPEEDALYAVPKCSGHLRTERGGLVAGTEATQVYLR